MTDREKVIRGLESLHTRLIDAATRDKIATLDMTIVANALALLKAQEPLEPIRKVIGYGWRYFCGKCGNSIVSQQHFCQDCGQAVKWE